MPYHKKKKKKKEIMSVFKKKPKKVRKAPKGFHIMPNGQLMSDAAHKPLKLPLRRNAFR